VPNKVFVASEVVVTCNGCQSVKKFKIDPPFRSAQAFIEWQAASAEAMRCNCGARTADIKLTIDEPN
jgi:hypothetical protein